MMEHMNTSAFPDMVVEQMEEALHQQKRALETLFAETEMATNAENKIEAILLARRQLQGAFEEMDDVLRAQAYRLDAE